MDRDKVAGSQEERDASPVSFALDVRSGVPTYLQIVQQVEAALRLGGLQSGDRLPKVKDVVSSLGINPNTVLKAYRELENRGITVGRPGVGTFVIAAPLAVSTETFLELRSLLLDGWLQTAQERGLQSDEIAALFHSALSEIDDPSMRPLSNTERGRSR
ncbi:MAG TPA: GntR family transcriptional regulator [Acidimicrobiales bacterium]|jgi:GntR family transcriptional regulator|nr:GntR family transcriptional regulator [Acidimicrobiales bacterium]